VTISDPIPARDDVTGPGQIEHPEQAEPIQVNADLDGDVARVQSTIPVTAPSRFGSHYHSSRSIPS